ncbi:MAG: G-protein coupled receptor [Sphingobium sp.]|jgi:hypothetical protein|nr:G-protein coupled receptor [Sphingobium sp.]MCI1271146.1 G-protein coupled receptor [Sphingobium sp.]MCI1754602.1 G-protein coupled receptor [Sphingobium sp.]MCI2052042.1 G-protein coupled receptor [Sphingobium sp.]
MDDSDALRNELNRQKRTAGVVTALWLALLGGMFVWQATQYHGFVELLAEWQYRVLDHYYPGITIALLSLFFSVPLLAMLFILWRRWRAKNEETGDPVGIMLSASRRLRRVCGFLALLSTAGALLVYVLSLWLPREGMPVHLVDIRNAQSPSVPEGSATVVGPVDMEALVRFDDRALLFHRRLYFAPVRYRLRGEALPARFFVQVEERADLPRHFLPVRSGVLARGALPGDVERLYRNIRYPVAERPYLLYRDGDTLRWRYHMLAGQMAIVAALLALSAWREGLRGKRIERRIAALNAKGTSASN